MARTKLTTAARAERKAIADYLLLRGDMDHEKARMVMVEMEIGQAPYSQAVKLSDYYYARAQALHAACAEVRKGKHTRRRAAPKRSTDR